MAQVTTIDVTSLIGTDKFPVNTNDVYGLVETLAVQNIRSVESSNEIEDAFYEYKVDNGAVVEEAIIKMAERQAFVNVGEGEQPDLSPLDPTLYCKYFNNWEESQFKTSVRRDDIRKVIADKGTGVEEFVSAILNTLTLGEGKYDQSKMLGLIKDSQVGVDATTLLGGVPANAKGITYALREMYNALKATNNVGGVPCEQATPVDDIRIAISESVLNLIDVTELAQLFNLEKVELMGKIVKLPFEAQPYNTILVYDRKALGRGTRLYEYTQDIIGGGRYTNHYLTTSRVYFYNSLFKCLKLDVSKAVATEKANLLTTA